MRKLLIGVLLFSFIGTARAQQDPQFSQYMFNAPYWSVALTGLDGETSISAFSRSQWLGYETSFDQQGGAPSTQFLNFSSPINIIKVPLSIGANFIYDKLGPMTNVQVQFGLAYHLEFPRGTLSAGIRPTINNQSLNYASLDFLNPLDERDLGEQQSQFAMDLDIGIGYTSEDYVLGIGISHLLKPTYDYGLPEINGSNEAVDFLYNLYGEYDYLLTYRITLSPSALIQTDINTYSFNLGLVLTYDEKLWGGFSYRNAESVVVLIGYSFFENNSLQLGYSFDYLIYDKEVKANTSHELYLRYNLPSLATGDKKIIRTPRFRF